MAVAALALGSWEGAAACVGHSVVVGRLDEQGGPGGAAGGGAAGALNCPCAIAVPARGGGFFVVDLTSVWRVGAGGAVALLAGGSEAGWADGAPSAARSSWDLDYSIPVGLALAPPRQQGAPERLLVLEPRAPRP